MSAVLEYQIAWKLGKNIHSLLQSSLSLGLRLVGICVCVFVNLFQEDAKFSVVSCTSVMLELEQQTFKGNLKHILPEQMMRGMVGFHLVCVTFVSDSVGGRRIGRS